MCIQRTFLAAGASDVEVVDFLEADDCVDTALPTDNNLLIQIGNKIHTYICRIKIAFILVCTLLR